MNFSLGMANTGVGRTPILDVLKRIAFCSTYSNAGTRNGILMGSGKWTTNASFTQPAWGGTVSVTFTSTVGIFAGMYLSITSTTPTTGWYQVVSITDATHAVLMNVGQLPTSTKQGATVATSAPALQNGLVNGQFVDAFFRVLQNHPDPSQRIYFTPELKDGSDERTVSNMKAFKDKTKEKLEQGPREVDVIFPRKSASPQLLGILNTCSTVDISGYEIDLSGNFAGSLAVDSVSGLNILYPFRFDSNSFDPIFNRGKDDDGQMIHLVFDVHSLEKDENISALFGWNPSTQNGDIASNVHWEDYAGLATGSCVFSSILSNSAGTFTFTLTIPGGSAQSPFPDVGLTLASMVSPNSGASGYVYDATAAADVAITSVTERKNGIYGTGIYDVVLGAHIATSLDKVSMGIVRAGRDYSGIPSQGGTNPNYSFISD